MDARDQLREKCDQRRREAEQERRWEYWFIRLLTIWVSIFAMGYWLLPEDVAMGALVGIFTGGLGVVASVAVMLSRRR
jgi:hypothetical protein